ncbi:P27 family phage terminase small subunit [Lichenicola cladoniae]|uniref:P27 family phage terminase small subunit n=1 Tax=Lichenicola cladoniae TaxID=1484109 RepID=A0A6M8HNB4_9PROT|nr:P27 family phage terminase small subunit [Lichenicola cladoniae]NPD67287.1 P27 family phage terminase small subunit [Acetobacteraceae bacterium]QKE89790.1 P27 family phage terminase small subunit [Lichenicola cladoniae]
MGRPRKPTHLKVVGGTAQPCRTNKAEPKLKAARLAAPAHLSRRAKLAWAKASRLLHDMGVLTVADGVALEGLCEAIADQRDARSSLSEAVSYVHQEHGAPREVQIAAAGSLTYITVGNSGPMIRMRPEVAAIADADRRVSMWLAKFGLTPADRSRVGAAGMEKTNPFAAL